MQAESYSSGAGSHSQQMTHYCCLVRVFAVVYYGRPTQLALTVHAPSRHSSLTRLNHSSSTGAPIKTSPNAGYYYGIIDLYVVSLDGFVLFGARLKMAKHTDQLK